MSKLSQKSLRVLKYGFILLSVAAILVFFNNCSGSGFQAASHSAEAQEASDSLNQDTPTTPEPLPPTSDPPIQPEPPLPPTTPPPAAGDMVIPKNPFILTKNFEGGTNQALIPGADFASNANGESSTRYNCGSNLYEGSCSAKMTFVKGVPATGFEDWKFPRLQMGEEMWFSMAMYVTPDSKIVSTNGGGVKFLAFYTAADCCWGAGRFWVLTANNVFDATTDSSKPLFVITENFPHQGIGKENDFKFGQWVRFEVYMKMASSTGKVRIWYNGNLVTSLDNIKTTSAGTGGHVGLDTAMILHYWNDSVGGDNAQENAVVYLDDLRVTNDPRNATRFDAQGNRMIGP